MLSKIKTSLQNEPVVGTVPFFAGVVTLLVATKVRGRTTESNQPALPPLAGLVIPVLIHCIVNRRPPET